VIAFFPKSTPGQIAWVDWVADDIPLEDYERKYTGRRDAIYRSSGRAADGGDILQPLRDGYNVNRRQADLRGKNVPVFSPFWYLGGSGVATPEDSPQYSALLGKCRNHSWMNWHS
jgi:hypothetical protein